jgi:hypothetical protein
VADCGARARCERVTCEAFQCERTPIAGADAWRTEPFDSLDGWVVVADRTGAAWRLGTSQYISAGSSLHYGTSAGGYDVGATRGTITSPAWEVPANVPSETLTLRFWRNLRIESISSRDLLELHLIRDGHAPLLLWDKGFGTGPGIVWREDEVSLPTGITGVFQLRWSFDTIDGVDNGGTGVFIDDLRLMGPCP